MKDKLLEQAKHEYSPKQRTVALLFMAPIFLFLLPWLFLWLGARLDGWLAAARFLRPSTSGPLDFSALPGWAFGLWANYSQFTLEQARLCRSWQPRN